MAENENIEKIHFAENYDQATIEQVQNIETQIADSCALVGEKEEINVLSHDYSRDDEVYQGKLKDLYSRYTSIRKTRGDGNCFYRSFGFKTLEACLTDVILTDKMLEVATLTKDNLIKLGYPSYTVEDFQETFSEVLEIARKSDNLYDITQVFNDQGYSDYFVVFLRLMVSCYLQENHEFYSAFIEDHPSMKDFCSQEVEPMSKESDHIHIIALSNVCRVTIQVEYMDRSGDGQKVNHHVFPDDGSKPTIYLLYRPGHYDILYKRENDQIKNNDIT